MIFLSSYFLYRMYNILSLDQDEDEFPDLANGRNVQRNPKAESHSAQTHIQPKMPKNLVGRVSV